MEASIFEPELRAFKRAIEEIPSSANNWEFTYDGVVRKDYPDSHMKIYKRKLDGESVVTIRIEGTMKGLEAKNLHSMLIDIDLRRKWDPILKEFEVLEKVSKNCDIVHQEANLPFPLRNRDFVHKRIYLSSKDDQELLKALGVFDWTHNYYILIGNSTQKDECPPRDNPVRGDTIMNYWLIEEDPKEELVVKVTVLVCQDMKGNVPHFLVNMAASTVTHKAIAAVLDKYHQLFSEKGTLNLK